MKLEQQVCSLELAKKLKELGVEQESYFWWTDYGMPHIITDKSIFWEKTQQQRCFSAFTVAELGELLPKFYLTRRIGENWWEATKAFATKEGLHEQYSQKEADARAKMLVYLIENNLITI